ncbi:MAG: CHASE2 domain-containing protein [Verrucomicrobiales bacterium]|nr:CHASE2 domain-containing protein [Verrucomicrobiales bacterium]
MARFRPEHAAPGLIAAGLLTCACVLQAVRPAPVELLELKTFDWRARVARHFARQVATNLGLVFISDKTIAVLSSGELGFRYGLYWPRHIYGRAVHELATQGANAIAIDILFGELRPDHAPVQVDQSVEPGLEQWLGALRKAEPLLRVEDKLVVESDEYFAWRLRQARNVILAAEATLVPHPLFATNALCLGDVALAPDPDGVMRRVKVFSEYRIWHPLFKLAESDPDYGIDLRKARVEQDKIVLARTGLPDIVVPLDAEGNFELADFIGENIPAGWAPKAKPFRTVRVWQLGIALAAQQLGLDLERAELDLARGRVVISNASGLRRVIPVDADGYMHIDWSIRPGDRELTKEPLEELLRKHVLRTRAGAAPPADTWRDKLAIICSAATGSDLADRGATPLESEGLLVGAHLNVANSVLTGRFVRRAGLLCELALICALGVCTAFGSWRFRPGWATANALALGFIYLGVCAWVYVQQRYWLPIVMPLVGGVLLQHAGLVTYRVVFAERERRRVRSIFSKLVAPEVVQELLSTGTLALGGASREVTVMFADLREFTRLTDTARAEAAEFVRRHGLTGAAAEACFEERARSTLATVNLYLSIVAETVKNHGGTLDKYIGDCVMAFWGAPRPDPMHGLNAVRAAIAVQRAVAALNRSRMAENLQISRENELRAERGEPPLPLLPVLSLGIGINSGVVTVGLMGSESHILNYTVFGRDVNLASRLENLSAGAQILIGEATFNHLVKLDAALASKCVPMPPATVKGFRDPIKFYMVTFE